MDIATCFSPNWARHVAIGMFSLLRHNDGPIRFHLLTDKLDQDDIDRFIAVCAKFGQRASFKVYDLDRFYETRINSRFISPGRFTKYTFFKLGIAHFIPSDRLLFLDADAICLGNIEQFYHQDLGGNLIAGCIDIGVGRRHKARIRMSNHSPYINAGMVLFDLAAIREAGIHEQWLTLCQKTRLPLNDQDAINLTCSPRIKVVNIAYNTSASTGLEVTECDIKILHLAGPKNPWVARLPYSNYWYDAERAFDIFMGPLPEMRIPPTIYYGWFGGADKPRKILDCIESWRNVCRGFDIIELNESNCDVHCNAFVREAYAAQKWGFVWDYFRMKAMYDWGGVSLDADVEVLQPLDRFMTHRFFSGQEIDGQILITATMGSEPHNPLVKAILDYYETAEFVWGEVKPNTAFITEIFKTYIAQTLPDGTIELCYGGVLYPQRYFCNYDHRRRRILYSADSHACHWFEGSWKRQPTAIAR